MLIVGRASRHVPGGGAIFFGNVATATQSVSENCGRTARLLEEPVRFVNTVLVPRQPPSQGRPRFAILATMTSRDSASSEITPEVLLRAYACGIFPMAESADDPTLFWVEPELRGVIPFDGFRIASRLARTVRSDVFTVTVDTAFKAVIAGCAAPQPGRDDTWINKRIRDLYLGLYTSGHCHSVEVWQDDNLVGGLYGVSLGRAFFGESMFHTTRDASKVALVHLVARLIAGGFELLDTQYVTEHLKTFGAVEISRRRYRALLDKAISGVPADFRKLDATQPVKGADALAIIAARN